MHIKVHQIVYDDLILRDLGDDYTFINHVFEVEGQWYNESLRACLGI